ncbi:MAG TPA: M1 family metallopeptidase [Candidatus Acidoferrales bacterium]|nr:M1 family metallopeptidase [Candidatus Acidoferrales bacterium]
MIRPNAVCFCALALAAGCARATPPGSAGVSAPSYHPALVAPYRFDDTIVRLHFDLARGELFGDELAIVRPKRAGLTQVPFDSAGITYQGVTAFGKPVSYRVNAGAQTIAVLLPVPAAANERIPIEFTYRTVPQRGVYFVRPDTGYPHVTPQIWSQGEPTDNRRWFPTWDQPNEKTPSELIVTVPRGWTVVGNGSLKSRVRGPKTETWDWNSPRPKSAYLIAFAAGPLAGLHSMLGSLPIDSYVQPKDAALNALCFGRTGAMIAYYQRVIGFPYPFAKYDQTTAERFAFGGMENASATTIASRALHLPVQEDEDSCDLVVSHELAQQWFGDDVTMSDWSNVWINEGFATYFDELWTGERFGTAAFEYARYRAQERYFDETKRYLRPIVTYEYGDPLELFDSSGHERPAEALHMLRYLFGDRRFFGALHAYLNEYQYRNADTQQFFAAIGAYLHENLDWFEQEWFFRPDYPHYVVSDAYDAPQRRLVVRVRQENADRRPFRMPIVIEAFFDHRVARVQSVIDRNDQTVGIPMVTSPPQMVLFDPDNEVVRQLTFVKPLAELRYQLRHAAHVADREWALGQLEGFASSRELERDSASNAIREVVRADSFYGLRADAAEAAVAFQDAGAIDAALHDRDKRVRLAAESAAAELRHATIAVIDDLYGLANDPDPTLAAGALSALGAAGGPGTYERLVTAVRTPSFRETLAGGALAGLAALGDPRALPLIEAKMRYGTPDEERNAAVRAFAQLSLRVGETSSARRTLATIADDDPLVTTRVAALDGLGMLGSAAIPDIAYVARTDPSEIVQLAARQAMGVTDFPPAR